MAYYTSQNLQRLNAENKEMVRDFVRAEETTGAFREQKETKREAMQKAKISQMNPNPLNIRLHKPIDDLRTRQNSVISYLKELNQ